MSRKNSSKLSSASVSSLPGGGSSVGGCGGVSEHDSLKGPTNVQPDAQDDEALQMDICNSVRSSHNIAFLRTCMLRDASGTAPLQRY